jgi:2,3-bisphosphoglycerate-dependent phosphoglycerate mutase
VRYSFRRRSDGGNNGLIAGLTREEADRRYPKLEIIPPHTSVYGQESRIAFRMRLETMLSKILSDNPETATVAVVSHGNAICQLFNAFLQSPVHQTIQLASGDTAIHHLRIHNSQRSIVFANRQEHL